MYAVTNVRGFKNENLHAKKKDHGHVGGFGRDDHDLEMRLTCITKKNHDIYG